MRRAWSSSVLAVVGCSFHGSYDGTHYQCGTGDTCPGGQTCVNGACVIDGVADADLRVDAPPGGADGAPDASMTSSRCGTLALARDDFATDKLGVIWDRWSDGGPVATVTGGHLSISIPQNTQDLGAGYESIYYYDFTGSVLEAAVSKVASTDTILEVRGLGGGKMQMVLESGVLYAWVGNPGGGGTQKAQVTYDPATHKRWRLREDGGSTYWEWSTDGVAWTELHHEIDPFPPDHVRVELAADGSAASEAIFEEVDVDTPPPAGFCGTDTLIDDFGATAFGPWLQPWHNGGASIAETGGQVVATIPATQDTYAGFDSRHLYDLREHPIYIDAHGTSGAAQFTSFFQLVAPGDQTFIEMARQGASLTCDVRVAGTIVSTVDVAYDDLATRYWRVRLAGTTIHWETSPDAATWTEQHAATTAVDWSAVHVNAGQGFYGAPAAPVTSAWSGINTK